MRVAHVINSLTKASGLSTFCANLTQHLAESGVDIDLYVRWVGNDAFLPTHERIRIYETRDTRFEPAISPDIVHIHSLWVRMAHSGCAYARARGIPYVLSPHGMLSPWALKHKWWKKLPGMVLYQYRDLRKATLLHATAQSELAHIRRLRLRQDVTIIPLGTELPPRLVATARRDATKMVLFLSRIHPVKGLKNLISAWALVKRVSDVRSWGGPDGGGAWRLVIAGPDELGHRMDLLRLAQSLGLCTCDLSGEFDISRLNYIGKEVDVVFTGAVYGEEKIKLHGMAELFVLPSFTENFGAVVSDSLAHGVPVITTKGTPWAELEGACFTTTEGSGADAGRCGWWIDIGVEPLVGALKEAMNMTDGERRMMGANGRRLIESRYQWPVVAIEMLKAYEEIRGSR